MIVLRSEGALELLTGETGFAELVAGGLDPGSSFRLADIGCSGGIDASFRAFGRRLAAWAFDIDAAECARLQAIETLPGIRYIAGRVGLSDGHPFLLARGGRGWTEVNPWNRLSVAVTQRFRQRRAAPQPAPAPAPAPGLIDLTSFFATEGVTDLDFLKIDVDGADFAILSGLDGKLAPLGVLAVGIEVNFYETDSPTDHTLRNIDRFLRREGYDLFGLTVRHYSTSALPSRYAFADLPAQGRFGRPLQGDALHVRDVCAPAKAETAASLPAAKLAKVAAIFSLAGLPDCAAEVLIDFRDRLAPAFEVDAALDLLTGMAREEGMPTRYRDYCAAFAEDAASFYQRRDQPPAPAPAAGPPRGGDDAREVPAESPAIDVLLRENAELRRDLSALHGSRSWRLTAPLRRAADRLRSIMKSVG